MKRTITEICLYLIILLWILGLYYLARMNMHSNSIKLFLDCCGCHSHLLWPRRNHQITSNTKLPNCIDVNYLPCLDLGYYSSNDSIIDSV